MKKLIQWIRWNTLALMPEPDPDKYQIRYCEITGMDRGYDHWCADCDMVDKFNSQGLVSRWRERLSWRETKKQSWNPVPVADEYDPFAPEDN